MKENNAFRTLTTFSTSMEAHVCANALEAAGFNAVVVGEHTAECRVGTIGCVEVHVPCEQFDKASALLQEIGFNHSQSEINQTNAEMNIEQVRKRRFARQLIAFNILGAILFLVVCLLNR